MYEEILIYVGRSKLACTANLYIIIASDLTIINESKIQYFFSKGLFHRHLLHNILYLKNNPPLLTLTFSSYIPISFPFLENVSSQLYLYPVFSLPPFPFPTEPTLHGAFTYHSNKSPLLKSPKVETIAIYRAEVNSPWDFPSNYRKT